MNDKIKKKNYKKKHKTVFKLFQWVILRGCGQGDLTKPFSVLLIIIMNR